MVSPALPCAGAPDRLGRPRLRRLCGLDLRRLREAVDDIFFSGWSALRSFPGGILRRCNKGYADPFLLNPGDLAFITPRGPRNPQPELRGHEGGIVYVDGGALGRDISHHAAHD